MKNFSTKVGFFLKAAILFSCIFFISFTYSKTFRISILLKFIPQEEKYFLEVFLRTLISHENGNCVLFGEKPASFIFFNDGEKFNPEAFFLHRFPNGFFSPIAKGFKIWNKYERFLLSHNFIIIRTRSFQPDYSSEIFLIHKKRLYKILEENFIEFKKYFPEFKSSGKLLRSVINNNSILEKMCRHDNLLGIILGYGKENAELFEREFQIDSFLFPEQNQFIANSFKPYMILQPSPDFETLNEELTHLRLKGKSIVEPMDHFPIRLMLHRPLSFLVDVTKNDIHLLRAQLQKQHRDSTQVYEKGKFLEVTLQRLAA